MKKYKHIVFLLALVLVTTLGVAQTQSLRGANLVYAASGSSSTNCAPSNDIKHNCIVTNYLVPAINFLSAGVGIVIIIMIVIGAVQYSTSGGNPQGEANARKKIFNALLALITFIFIYSFLNFIVPGGLWQI